MGWIYRHLDITVTTAQNSGIWLALDGWPGLLICLPGPLTKTWPKRLWPPLQAQLLPIWVVAMLIEQCNAHVGAKVRYSWPGCHKDWKSEYNQVKQAGCLVNTVNVTVTAHVSQRVNNLCSNLKFSRKSRFVIKLPRWWYENCPLSVRHCN